MNRLIVLSLTALLALALDRPLTVGGLSPDRRVTPLPAGGGGTLFSSGSKPDVAPASLTPMGSWTTGQASPAAETTAVSRPKLGLSPAVRVGTAPRAERVQLARAVADMIDAMRTGARARRVYPEGVYTIARRGRGLVYQKGILAGAPVHVVKADLRDPEVKVGIVMARGGIGRYESFLSMINRTAPAASITGTFFGLRNGLPTGDIVVNGRAIYQGFIGTALAITDGNVVSFIPTDYKEATHWGMFDTVVRGGPRLVFAGEMAVNPREEGFRTLAGDALRSRTAVGITPKRQLLLVTVKSGVTLRRLAMVMRALGAYHAVALDGGSSSAMSFGGRVIAQPARALTNLLVVYADRGRYERARQQFYSQAQRRVLPSGSPTFPADLFGAGAAEVPAPKPVAPASEPAAGQVLPMSGPPDSSPEPLPPPEMPEGDDEVPPG